MRPNQKLISAFDDLISENDVKTKFSYSSKTLQRLRKSGQLKNWSTINGRKIMYSKTEIAQLLNLHLQ